MVQQQDKCLYQQGSCVRAYKLVCPESSHKNAYIRAWSRPSGPWLFRLEAWMYWCRRHQLRGLCIDAEGINAYILMPKASIWMLKTFGLQSICIKAKGLDAFGIAYIEDLRSSTFEQGQTLSLAAGIGSRTSKVCSQKDSYEHDSTSWSAWSYKGSEHQGPPPKMHLLPAKWMVNPPKHQQYSLVHQQYLGSHQRLFQRKESWWPEMQTAWR